MGRLSFNSERGGRREFFHNFLNIFFIRERLLGEGQGVGRGKGRESLADSALSEEPNVKAPSHDPEIMI